MTTTSNRREIPVSLPQIALDIFHYQKFFNDDDMLLVCLKDNTMKIMSRGDAMAMPLAFNYEHVTRFPIPITSFEIFPKHFLLSLAEKKGFDCLLEIMRILQVRFNELETELNSKLVRVKVTKGGNGYAVVYDSEESLELQLANYFLDLYKIKVDSGIIRHPYTFEEYKVNGLDHLFDAAFTITVTHEDESHEFAYHLDPWNVLIPLCRFNTFLRFAVRKDKTRRKFCMIRPIRGREYLDERATYLYRSILEKSQAQSVFNKRVALITVEKWFKEYDLKHDSSTKLKLVRERISEDIEELMHEGGAFGKGSNFYTDLVNFKVKDYEPKTRIFITLKYFEQACLDRLGISNVGQTIIKPYTEMLA